MFLYTGQFSEILTNQYIQKSFDFIVVDLREKNKYNKGHIPDAINIPFDVKLISNTYNLEEWIIKNQFLINTIIQKYFKSGKKILIYCSTGKIHSKLFFLILKKNKVDAEILTGGYEAYMKYVKFSFNQPCNLIVISGETGSKKTEILRSLRNMGEQVIDLEGLACHNGSVFGGFNNNTQPTHEQFQINLFQAWNSIDYTKRIWIEDEIRHIGSVGLPDYLWDLMQKATYIYLTVPKDIRIKHIISQYGNIDIKHLLKSIQKVKNRLAIENANMAIKYLVEENFEKVVEILLSYYDRAYQKRMFERIKKKCIKIKFTDFEPTRMSEEIVKIVQT